MLCTLDLDGNFGGNSGGVPRNPSLLPDIKLSVLHEWSRESLGVANRLLEIGKHIGLHTSWRKVFSLTGCLYSFRDNVDAEG